MTPEALYKAAQLAESMNKTSDAIDFFKKIRDEYPKTSRAADIDKNLARLGVLN
jgi:TolA-binding protein